MNRTATILLSSFALVTTLAAATVRDEGDPQKGKPHASAASAKPVMQIYKSPTCGCCKQWVEHIAAAGFTTRVVDLDEEALQKQKAKLGVGEHLQSCHTATVGGYVVEGHVPAADILRLLAEKPKVVGLAAPGMPRGSPGMEMPNGSKDKYDVLAFDKGGATKVFARH